MLNRIVLSQGRQPNSAVRETCQGGVAQRRWRNSYWLGLLAVLGVLALLPAMTRVESAMQTSCLMDGDLDPTFDGDGRVTTDFLASDQANAVALQPDGKIVVAGANNIISQASDFVLARYNADGSLDTSFDTDGRVTTAFGPSNDQAIAVVLQPDGKIVAAGFAVIGGSQDFALARYNVDGSLDTSFDGDGRVTTAIGSGIDQANAVALQPDGKIVAAGFTRTTNVTDAFALVRYNTDGSLDTTFDTDGRVTTVFGSSTNQATAVVLQPDGKIVVAGLATISGSGQDFALARYNADGSLDTTFDTDGRVTTDFGSSTDQANAVALQPDGRIVAAGLAVSSGSVDFGLVRYNPDGSLDTSFDIDGRMTTTFIGDDRAQAVALQPDGKIVAAGFGISGGGSNVVSALARYNVDGSLDTSFDTDGRVTTIFRPKWASLRRHAATRR